MWRVLLTFLCGGFALACVGLAAGSQGEDRFLAAVGALFLVAAVGAPLLLTRLPRKGAEGITLRQFVRKEGEAVPAFAIPYWPLKQILAFCGCMIFVLVGYALLRHTHHAGGAAIDTWIVTAVALVMMAFFGAGALRLAAVSFGQKGGLLLMPSGIFCPLPFQLSFIPWDAIEEVALFEWDPGGAGPQLFLGVRLTAPERFVDSRSARLSVEANRGLCGWEVAYPALQFTLSPEVVAATLQFYLQHPEERARIGTAEGLVELKRALEQAGTTPSA